MSAARPSRIADDRDPAADAGLESDRDSSPAGGREKIAAALGKQGFVGGDDVASVGDRPPHVRAGAVDAADDFHDQVAMRVEHLGGARGQQPPVDARPRLRQIAHEDPLDGQLDAVPLADAIALALDELHDAGTDGAASKKSDA